MDEIIINSFLKFGYDLKFENKDYIFNFSKIDKNKYSNIDERTLVDEGKKALYTSFENIFESGKKNVVPLSGGLDSRAILAVLLEFTEAKNIYTYTFGTPTTLDYEIGNFIAKVFNTKHISYDLSKYEYTQKELIRISNKIDGQTVLFHHPPLHEIEKEFIDGTIWSGFMGDPIAGGHLSNCNTNDIFKIKDQFIQNNTYAKSIKLDCLDNSKYYEFIEDFGIDEKLLTLQEQFDFNNRQLKFVAPHVLVKGFEYKIPFLEDEWTSFILSVDNRFRYNQYLHKKILGYTFPKIFNYPTKTNYGAKLNANLLEKNMYRIKNYARRQLSHLFTNLHNPMTNYIDFNKGIRTRKDLNRIIYSNIADLASRNIVHNIDVMDLWNAHISKKENYGDALLLLTSLEINLKAKNL